jgi:hypothetical protein
MLTADYLIIGSGAAGMSFADQLLTETNANIVIVDRHHLPGGHWNDAYSFVRLHAPSAFYGVGSRQLGSNRIDVSGLNRGYYELASGAEIVSYFDKLMQERFLPSGRVQYFPMCEHLGDGRFVSRLSGKIQQVAFSKRLVNATFLDTQVPSTHTPSFQVAEGVKLVTPNLLPISAPGHQRHVILGGGKTAMDVGIWLLQMGARPESIRWIVPQDSWLRNRDTTQPGDAFFERTAGGMAHQFEAAAEATSVVDLFERLERGGQMLRIDRTVWPTAFRGATLSTLEVEALSTIKDVVRKGRVRRIERDAIVLERGKVDLAPDDLYVDCTAKAFSRAPRFRSSMGIRSRSSKCVPDASVSALPSSHMWKRSMTMTRSRTICVRRFRRQTSLQIGLGVCSRICEMGGDGRPKKRCVRGPASTDYQAPDSRIPAWRRVPKGYAFLSVCAKPVCGPRQTWHGLSPNSIDPSRIGKADAALVCSWRKAVRRPVFNRKPFELPKASYGLKGRVQRYRCVLSRLTRGDPRPTQCAQADCGGLR